MADRSKLAVILHADVVGSTSLVQKDEHLAHDRIREAFQRLSNSIVRFGGIAHEIRGDALVAEFNRASDAVAAGLAFQGENRVRNEALPGDIRPDVRVGIALGEVIIADETITGAGVVLAQRLEQLAEPGGVCVQGAVHEAVPRRLPFDYSYLGEQPVKGFDEPVRVYSVGLRPGEALTDEEAATSPKNANSGPHLPRSAIILIGLFIVAGGTVAWLRPWHPDKQSLHQPAASTSNSGADETRKPAIVATTEAPDRGLPDRPSIVVLPFANVGDDAEQGYFADGITEDITTDLSKVSGLFVTARASAFSYKNQHLDIKMIAARLGVRYVATGSVRRAGEKIRINVQLVDASTGRQMWADRYDGVLVDVFALQDTISEKIVAALAVQFNPTEEAAVRVRETENSAAYDAFLRGMRELNARDRYDFQSNERAQQEFREAIRLDPEYARAYAALGWAIWLRHTLLSAGDAEARHRAFEFAKKSIGLRDNALARRVLARQHLAPDAWAAFSDVTPIGSQSYDRAEAELRKALVLEPSNADTLAELADVLALSGKATQATDAIERAMRLNPNFPGWYNRPAGIAHYLNGAWVEAAAKFKAWRESEVLPKESTIWLCAAFAQAGNLDRARELFESFNRERPGVSYVLEHFAGWYRFREDRDLDLFVDGLRKAGVPSLRSSRHAG